MISPGVVIASVMPVYLLMIAGAVLRRIGVLRREHDQGVMHVVFSVMLPCFILDKILGSPLLRSGAAVGWAAFLGFGLIMVGILIGLAVGRLMGLERGTGMRTFALSAGCQNFGFTAAPVVEILWGSGALALLFVHNIGVEMAMWSVGVMMMSGERGISWRKLVNGPIMAVLIGLVLVALGLDDQVTGAVEKVDLDDRRGSLPGGDPDHGGDDHRSGSHREAELEGDGGRLAGAAGAGPGGDSVRGEVSAAGHRAETGAGGAGGDAGGAHVDPAGPDVRRPAGGGGAGGDRVDGAEFPDAAVDHHVGKRVDRAETGVAMSGRAVVESAA